MFSLARDEDTICAVSTPEGRGAISIVRISGKNTVAISRKLAPFLPAQLESHHIYYGFMHTTDEKDQLDEVLASYFSEGRSFTGEETIEFSCHGSPVLTQLILQNLVLAGARIAEKGEFTYRAFKNGRIDLTQAESVLLMIESQSKQSAQMALRQLRGELAQKYKKIEDALVWCLSRLEANIDFSAEDIEFAAQAEILQKAVELKQCVTHLLHSYSYGRVVKEGLRVALVGAPNVGKSSLLNVLAYENRAIVSPIAGTTRDTIEIQIEIFGRKITLVDTAGVHVTDDQIEKLGIERTRAEMAKADMVLFIQAANEPVDEATMQLLSEAQATIVEIVNKSDLNLNYLAQPEQILTSVVTGQGVDKIFDKLKAQVQQPSNENSASVMVARQFELLGQIERQVTRALTEIQREASPELVIAELNEALFATMELTGRRFDDEVLDRVFKDFCLGK